MNGHCRKSRAPLAMLALVLCICTRASAQDAGPIVIGQRVKVHSNILNEDRMLWIYNPDTARVSTTRYPVIYLLDGESQFTQTAAIVEYLSNVDRMPQMIIVGLANTNRVRDLTPQPADTAFPLSGGADTFLQCVKEEVVPYIEAHYRTLPFRLLVGYSLGGAFALNAFLHDPGFFNSYILASPTLWWDNGTQVNQLGDFLRKPPKVKALVYETQTVWESPQQFNQVQHLLNLVETYKVEGLDWKVHIVQDETHASIVLGSIYDGLKYIYAPWPIRGDPMSIGMAGVQKHFKELSDRYGYRIDPPESMINQLGYQYLARDKTDSAIAIFKWNVQHYPASWNVYDSLGEAYAKKGDKKAAIENYEKSVALNPQNTSGIRVLKTLKAK